MEKIRISRDRMLMDIAKIIAERGTCSRASVGAVIARDSRIISTGYNGVISGLPHCDHSEFAGGPCLDSIHAEMNAILFAARTGVSIMGAVMYTTMFPCPTCAKAIINVGISRIYFRGNYRLMDESQKIFQTAGVNTVVA